MVIRPRSKGNGGGMMHETGFKPMKVQFGPVGEGTASELVVGRTGLVEELWRQLDTRSLRLLAERRMGKTWVLRLALSQPPPGVSALLFDVQRSGSAPEFVWQLNEAMHARGLISDKWWKWVGDWFRRAYQSLQGQKVAKIELPEFDPWSHLLEDTCRNFVAQGGEGCALLVIDELPFFLDKLIKEERHQDAAQLLDTFRSLREELPTFRQVFCGSLGLHIVLKKLHEKGYAGQPVNNMPPFEVPPLVPEDARYLAGCLLLGEAIPCSDVGAVASAVAEASSGTPFYIQHLVAQMTKDRNETRTPEQIRVLPEELFVAHGDPGEFAYYDGRLDDYYPEDIVEKARAVLDIVSRKPQGEEFDTLVNLVRHRPKTQTCDPEGILKVLRILRDDHYVLETDGAWRFKLEIVRRWWFDARGRLTL